MFEDEAIAFQYIHNTPSIFGRYCSETVTSAQSEGVEDTRTRLTKLRNTPVGCTYLHPIIERERRRQVFARWVLRTRERVTARPRVLVASSLQGGEDDGDGDSSSLHHLPRPHRVEVAMRLHVTMRQWATAAAVLACKHECIHIRVCEVRVRVRQMRRQQRSPSVFVFAWQAESVVITVGGRKDRQVGEDEKRCGKNSGDGDTSTLGRGRPRPGGHKGPGNWAVRDRYGGHKDKA